METQSSVGALSPEETLNQHIAALLCLGHVPRWEREDGKIGLVFCSRCSLWARVSFQGTLFRTAEGMLELLYEPCSGQYNVEG